jgi:hypothetical protein
MYSNVKVSLKVKWSLCLIRHHVMKVYKGVEVWLQTFLTLTLDGDAQ